MRRTRAGRESSSTGPPLPAPSGIAGEVRGGEAGREHAPAGGIGAGTGGGAGGDGTEEVAAEEEADAEESL